VASCCESWYGLERGRIEPASPDARAGELRRPLSAMAQHALRARQPCRPGGARLGEVDGAHARADVDKADQRARDLDADRRLRLLRGAADVRRQDDVGQALQLCARGAACPSHCRPGGCARAAWVAWLHAAAARPKGRAQRRLNIPDVHTR